jgi:hypothetical protein
MTYTAPIQRTRRNALSQPMPIRLLPDEVAKAEKFAAMEMRSRASFIRIIFLRGLEAYEADLLANA